MNKLALLSVSDKTKIEFLAEALVSSGYDIIATGKTASLLASKGIKVKEISSLTGFPEILDGRVKTLHPVIFGGILFRRDNPSDMKETAHHNIPDIDLVAVNLYPFIKTAENPDSSFEDIIENIDIGGPSLIRAAAKNYKYVSVLTDPSQYESFVEEILQGSISLKTKEGLAAAAFAHTSYYDNYIAEFLEKKFGVQERYFRLNLPKSFELRYGENPYQWAAVYGRFNDYFELLHGKELSYNNILDLCAASELVYDLNGNSCAIIKHNNPAGAASGNNLLDAYNKALRCDPVSAFGGIVAYNGLVDKETAEKMNEIFLEVISAPEYSEEALTVLKKKRDRRIIRQKMEIPKQRYIFREIPGGVIAQESDSIIVKDELLKSVTERKPTSSELEDLIFAMTIAKHTKSNAIVFVKDKASLGIGAGQMSRLDSCRIASIKASENGLDLKGSVAASDAFFPFPDGLLQIINAGSVSVIQPGGSVRDTEVINTANENNISMVFTGIRHFKH